MWQYVLIMLRATSQEVTVCVLKLSILCATNRHGEVLGAPHEQRLQGYPTSLVWSEIPSQIQC